MDQGRTLFKGMTLIDGTGNPPVKDAYFVVENGRIAERGHGPLPEDPVFHNTVDLSGKFVTPGLMNCHTHVVMEPVADLQTFFSKQTPATLAARGVANMQKLLCSGTTFVRDMGAPFAVDIDIKKCMQEGVFEGPDIYCSAKMITMTGGHGHWFGREADGPDEVRKAAREQLKRGADAVKTMATGGVLTEGALTGAPELTERELAALVDAAEAKERPTAAHAHGAEGIKNAVRAGI